MFENEMISQPSYMPFSIGETDLISMYHELTIKINALDYKLSIDTYKKKREKKKLQ